MIERRSALQLLAAMPLAAALRADRQLSSLDPARRSDDSRWYPFTSALEARLRDMSLSGWRLSPVAINNRHVTDLRDIVSSDQLAYRGARRILDRTEPWEYSAENPKSTDPEDDVGFPSLVSGPEDGKNGRYRLFYAIHDPDSGIGLAIAPRPDGPYAKVASLWGTPDSRILRAPPRPRLTSHFSSPVAVPNPESGLWHLYFHFYDNRFAEGLGHQHTALATSRNMRDWVVMKGRDGGILSVLPTTSARWMNSQSSYHVICRLPNGLWLAWLRGTGGVMASDGFRQDVTALGLAVSEDGIKWSLHPSSPQLVPARAPVVGGGVIRPVFIARLRNTYLCCWAESAHYDHGRRYVFATTDDFQSFQPTFNPIPADRVPDGPASLWRSGRDLWMLAGNSAHHLTIEATGA